MTNTTYSFNVSIPSILDAPTLLENLNANVNLEDLRSALCRVDSLVTEAVFRIRNAPCLNVPGFDLTKAVVGHSGGKDSVLVRYLTDLAFGYDTVKTVHTTKPSHVENAVHPLTRDFLYSMDRPILYVGLAQQKNLGLKVQIDGTRIAEHTREDGRSIDVVVDGKSVSRTQLKLYMENGLLGLDFVYPIYDWSDAEVWATILSKGIAFSREYLDT